MGSRMHGCPFVYPIYIPRMRLVPLLLVCALLACSKKPPQIEPTMAGAARKVDALPSAPPVSFVRTTAEAPATRTIEVRDGLTHQQAMRTLSDALSERYDVDVVDPRAGFAMTTWQASIVRDGVPDLRYRTRIVSRFIGDDWRSLRVQSEARWARGEEADIGYDSILSPPTCAGSSAKNPNDD
jgi:hypothetical protein